MLAIWRWEARTGTPRVSRAAFLSSSARLVQSSRLQTYSCGGMFFPVSSFVATTLTENVEVRYMHGQRPTFLIGVTFHSFKQLTQTSTPQPTGQGSSGS